MITPAELDELHDQALKINPRRIITEIAADEDSVHGFRTRVVTPCAQTCTTEKCYYEPEGRAGCPLC